MDELVDWLMSILSLMRSEEICDDSLDMVEGQLEHLRVSWVFDVYAFVNGRLSFEKKIFLFGANVKMKFICSFHAFAYENIHGVLSVS